MRVQNRWRLDVAMLMAIATAVPLAAQTAPAETKKPLEQAAPAATAPNTATPDPFAFPESDSKTKSMGEEPAAPAPAAAPATAPVGPDSSGYSSSSDGTAGNPPAGSAPDADARKKLELRDEGSAGHVDTARADKDETVADFYEKDGNYEGAYLRYKDAVAFDPDNAYDHFQLARLARKTGKTAEAMSEYSATVKLDPQGKYAKEARKMLAEMQPAAKK